MRKNAQILVGNLKGKKRFGKPRRKLKYNIKVGLKELDYEGVDWIQLAQDMA
jgi:hypothetical protein